MVLQSEAQKVDLNEANFIRERVLHVYPSRHVKSQTVHRQGLPDLVFGRAVLADSLSIGLSCSQDDFLRYWSTPI